MSGGKPVKKRGWIFFLLAAFFPLSVGATGNNHKGVIPLEIKLCRSGDQMPSVKKVGLFLVVMMLGALMGDSALAGPAVKLLKSQGGFSRPHDLTLSPDGKFLYVADLGNDRVQVLASNSLKVLGSIGAGELSDPHDVAFDKKGQLLVADTGNHRIAIFRVDGAKGQLISTLTEGLSGPEGVVAGADGAIYVADTSAHAVVLFKHGKRIKQLGRRGEGPGEFIRPHDVALDRHGNILATDPGNNRVQVLSENLEPMLRLGGHPYNFKEPKYLDRDEAGRMLVADQHNNRIVVLDDQYQPVLVIPDTPHEADGLKLHLPEGVVSKGKHVWVSDTYAHRILLFEILGTK